MSKNILKNLVKEVETKIINSDNEVFVEIENAFMELEESHNELEQVSSLIEEMYDFGSTLHEEGLSKPLALFAINNGYECMFENSTVSLQGYMDGTCTAEEVMVIMNAEDADKPGVMQKIRAAQTEWFLKLDALLEKIFNFIKVLSKWQESILKELENYSDTKKATGEVWIKLEDKKLKCGYNGKELQNQCKLLQEGIAVIKAHKIDKISDYMESIGFISDHTIFKIKGKKKSVKEAEKNNKSKTIKELGYKESFSGIYDATVALLKSVPNFGNVIKESFSLDKKEEEDLLKSADFLILSGSYTEKRIFLHRSAGFRVAAYKLILKEIKNTSKDAVKLVKMVKKAM